MKSRNTAEVSILLRAERLGYLVQESLSFEGRYYIIETSTNFIIAGAQDFMSWEEVVSWVQEAGIGPTLH